MCIAKLSPPSLTAVALVGNAVVPAVIDSIAYKLDVDTAAVSAGELSVGVTGGVRAVSLVAVVTAIISVVAGKAEWHAAAVVTGEVHRRAGVEGLAGGTTESPLMVKDDEVSKTQRQSDLSSCLTTHSLQLVRVVGTVHVAITSPLCTDAVAVQTSKLPWLTALACVLDAVFTIVGQVPFPIRRTLAFWTRWTCRDFYKAI